MSNLEKITTAVRSQFQAEISSLEESRVMIEAKAKRVALVCAALPAGAEYDAIECVSASPEAPVYIRAKGAESLAVLMVAFKPIPCDFRNGALGPELVTRVDSAEPRVNADPLPFRVFVPARSTSKPSTPLVGRIKWTSKVGGILIELHVLDVEAPEKALEAFADFSKYTQIRSVLKTGYGESVECIWIRRNKTPSDLGIAHIQGEPVPSLSARCPRLNEAQRMALRAMAASEMSVLINGTDRNTEALKRFKSTLDSCSPETLREMQETAVQFATEAKRILDTCEGLVEGVADKLPSLISELGVPALTRGAAEALEFVIACKTFVQVSVQGIAVSPVERQFAMTLKLGPAVKEVVVDYPEGTPTVDYARYNELVS